LNPYALFREAADFKSAVSASFTTRAARNYRGASDASRKKKASHNGEALEVLEARAGVEPTYTDLQSGA
jgi:hypothetical protein